MTRGSRLTLMGIAAVRAVLVALLLGAVGAAASAQSDPLSELVNSFGKTIPIDTSKGVGEALYLAGLVEKAAKSVEVNQKLMGDIVAVNRFFEQPRYKVGDRVFVEISGGISPRAEIKAINSDATYRILVWDKLKSIKFPDWNPNTYRGQIDSLTGEAKNPWQTLVEITDPSTGQKNQVLMQRPWLERPNQREITLTHEQVARLNDPAAIPRNTRYELFGYIVDPTYDANGKPQDYVLREKIDKAMAYVDKMVKNGQLDLRLPEDTQARQQAIEKIAKAQKKIIQEVWSQNEMFYLKEQWVYDMWNKAMADPQLKEGARHKIGAQLLAQAGVCSDQSAGLTSILREVGRKAGFDVRPVSGTTLDGGGHAFVIARLADGKSYIMDPSWHSMSDFTKQLALESLDLATYDTRWWSNRNITSFAEKSTNSKFVSDSALASRRMALTPPSGLTAPSTSTPQLEKMIAQASKGLPWSATFGTRNRILLEAGSNSMAKSSYDFYTDTIYITRKPATFEWNVAEMRSALVHELTHRKQYKALVGEAEMREWFTNPGKFELAAYKAEAKFRQKVGLPIPKGSPLEMALSLPKNEFVKAYNKYHQTLLSQTVGNLQPILTNPALDGKVRVEAARALGQLRSPAAVSLLLTSAIYDGNPDVRVASQEALKKTLLVVDAKTRNKVIAQLEAKGVLQKQSHAQKTAQSARNFAGGMAQFMTALLIKETMVALEKRDIGHLKSFGASLATPDLYVTYGIFSAGAQATNMGLAAMLTSRVGLLLPGIAKGIARRSLPLAVGMALVDLAYGQFEPKKFAISLGSFLAAGAIVQVLKWALIGGLVFTGPVGWLILAADLAVTLFLADKIDSFFTNLFRKDKKSSESKSLRPELKSITAPTTGSGGIAEQLEQINEFLDNFSAQPLNQPAE